MRSVTRYVLSIVVLLLALALALAGTASASAADEERIIEFENGDCFLTGKYTNKTIPTIEIEGDGGTATYYDDTANEWVTLPLEGTLPHAVVYVQTSKVSAIIGPAIAYEPHEYESLWDTGLWADITVSKTNKSYLLNYFAPQADGGQYHVWYMISKNSVFKWDENTKAIWQRLNFTKAHRICFDGAFYTTPTSYKPYAEGMFYRRPAVHPAGLLVYEDDIIMQELAFGLLEISLEFQNEEGYWATPPESNWLMEDYGISAGFYDTRFNCDLTQTLFKASEVFADNRFKLAALRQVDWLVEMSYTHSYRFGDGLLIQDYYAEDMTGQPHSSLNHTLQEIKVLLTAWKLTGTPRYYGTANRLLRGIQSTYSLWLSPEGGLEYAIFGDGTTGFTDYPYLTYNDLHDVREILKSISLKSETIDDLMAIKLEHMLQNNISGYYTPCVAQSDVLQGSR